MSECAIAGVCRQSTKPRRRSFEQLVPFRPSVLASKQGGWIGVEQLERRILLSTSLLDVGAGPQDGMSADDAPVIASSSLPEPSAGSQWLPTGGVSLSTLEDTSVSDEAGPRLDADPAPLAPPVITSFDAANFDTNPVHNGGFVFIPPDPIGAAGPNHVVNVVNTLIQWHTKAGVTQNTQSLQSFFSPLMAADFTFDPKVIYDQYAGRFVVVTLEQVGNSSRILVAVSDDSDPNGTWHFHAINSKLNIQGPRWADYPGLAVDEEVIYITANMFGFSAPTFGGSRLWIINKNPLYSGGTASTTLHDPSTAASLPSQAFTLQPAHTYGTAPTNPTNVGTWLVNTGWVETGGTADFVSVIRVDDPLGSTSFSNQFVSMGDITSGFSLPDAPQLGTSTNIETNDGRALNAVWRNDELWLTFTVNPPTGTDSGQATAHWVAIDTSTLGSLSLSDQGNVGAEDVATDTHTFFPSITVDGSGNMGIGFAASASTIYSGAYYTGRLASDPAGTVQTTGTLAAGTDFYIRTFGGSRNRWGDYSGISIDPSDDATFWLFNEYAMQRGTVISGEDGRWATRWGSFQLQSTSSVGDFVWDDLDGDGIQDMGEPGIDGVTVNLRDGTTSALITSTTTAAGGIYSFPNLASGDYIVEFIAPAGFLFSLKDQGADDTVDSDADPVTGRTDVFTLSSGSNDDTRDAGLFQPPTVQIIDDGHDAGAGFAIDSGSWGTGTRGYSAGGNNVASWTFTVTPGEYRVSATWFADVDRATDAPFTIFDGATALGTVDINQELAPNDLSDAGAMWEDLGATHIIASSTLVVQLSDDADDTVMADAIRVELVGGAGATIIDDGDVGFAIESGIWGTGGRGYQSDTRYAAKGDTRYAIGGGGSNVASWTFAVAPGEYRVSATWFAADNRATDAPFTILDGATPLGTVDINQELAPNDLSDAGAMWEDLGSTYIVTYTSLVVRLSDDADQFVMADAIRIERLGGLRPTADLDDPIDGAFPQQLALNAQSHIDVTFSDNTGSGLDTSTITDSAAEFTLSGAAAAGITIDDSTVSLVSGTTYRYLFTGTFGIGPVQVNFIAGSFEDNGSTTNLAETETFTVTSTIIDDGDVGFAIDSGSWGTGPRGYQDDTRFAIGGGGGNVASWTFTVTPGEYRISATWHPDDNRATDAPFTILDGASPLVTVDVNQELAPNDFSDAGADWEDLGNSYVIIGTSLVVELSDDADEHVMADAIRVEQLGGPRPTADLDDPADGAFPQQLALNTQGHIDVTFSDNTGNGLDTSTITDSAAEFTLSGAAAAGVTIDDSAVVLVSGTTYRYPFTGNFGTGEVQVNFIAGSFEDNGSASNLAETETFMVTGTVIDDGDAGFAIDSGSWDTGFRGYQDDTRFAIGGGGGNVASWTFTVTPGEYRVSATWFATANRATDAPFTILDGASALATVDVNQELAPNDFTDAGAAWEDLGTTHNIAGTTLVVKLSDDADDHVMADAVRIERLGNLPAGPSKAATTLTVVAEARNQDDDQTSLPDHLTDRAILSESKAVDALALAWWHGKATLTEVRLDRDSNPSPWLVADQDLPGVSVNLV